MARFAVTLLLLIAAVSEARAQTPSVRYTTEADPRNFAHAAFLGSGIYVIDGRQVYIIRANMGFTLRSPEKHPWGLRLTVTPTFGFYDFNPGDVNDFNLPSSLGTFSLLLGVQFHVPILSNWWLEPFVRAGPAFEFNENSVIGIFGTGVESRAEFQARRTRFLLWNTLLWAGNRESDFSPADDFARFDTTIEWLHTIGWTIHGRKTEIGPFVRSEIYFNSLVIAPPEGDPLVINHRYEVGVIWGAKEPHSFWKIPIPRTGLSVRFGDGALSYRLVLTTRF
jgi:hypothetical protein